jgi:YidC/Oxa1 family membrane protein insertase
MERRALIAVVISLVILVLYQEVVLKRLYPPPAEEETSSEPAPIAPPPANPPAPAPLADDMLAAAPKEKPAPDAQRIRIETDLYIATFTAAGARLESFQLKNYRTTVDPNSAPQETVSPGSGGELPFAVELRGAGSPAISDASAVYTTSAGSLTLKDGESGSLDFTWQGDPVTLQKHFTFRGDRYEFETTVVAQNVPPPYSEMGITWTNAVEAAPPPGVETVFDKTALLDGHKLVEYTFDKLAEGKLETGSAGATIGWAGFSGRHFLEAIMVTEPQNPRVWLKLRDHTVEEKLLFPISPGTATTKVDVYIGPKDFDAVETVGHNLSRAVALGWFWFIALPLLHVLKFLNRFTGNYGVDIILMTVVIKVLFIPLTKRSFESMRAMQKLQPQMAKIREKYKDDSETMNKEIMELYRRHKVNPLGGCLPMVLQIPVFIGLYSALMNAVELRHAPFMLWINDLSAPDRLGSVQLPFVQHPGIPVLTLLMGVSMFLQQWMSPSAGDPQQQKVMMIMPLMFTFMFVNYPAGLALYWLVNNVLTIAQQYYINRSAT